MSNEIKEKFTQGEWVKDYNGTNGHIKAMKNERDHVSRLRTPTIARYDVMTPSIPDEEKQANAHLIASAPDMYRELQKIESTLSTLSSVVLENLSLKVHVDSISKILAKARGEQGVNE